MYRIIKMFILFWSGGICTRRRWWRAEMKITSFCGRGWWRATFTVLFSWHVWATRSRRRWIRVWIRVQIHVIFGTLPSACSVITITHISTAWSCRWCNTLYYVMSVTQKNSWLVSPPFISKVKHYIWKMLRCISLP